MDQFALEQLKDKYWNIYQTTTEDGDVFVWRELSRGEWTKANRYYPDPYEREEYICKMCILEPDMASFDFNECKAGIIATLALQILQESGFGSVSTGKIESLMNKYDSEMTSFQHQVSCIITEAFPNLDISEVENWPLEKTIWYYSRAKYKLEQLRGVELVQEDNSPQVIKNTVPGAQIASGDMGDFPELRAQKAFMEGKMHRR